MNRRPHDASLASITHPICLVIGRVSRISITRKAPALGEILCGVDTFVDFPLGPPLTGAVDQQPG